MGTRVPKDKYGVCFCSELLFCKMVNAATAGRIKEMGWNKVDLSRLALLQENEHSLG